jgi:hypothetical protein
LTLFIAIWGDNPQIAQSERDSSRPDIAVTTSSPPAPQAPNSFISTLSEPFPFLNAAFITRQEPMKVFYIQEAPPYNRFALKFWLDTGEEPFWLRLPQLSGTGLSLNRNTNETRLNTLNIQRSGRDYTQFELRIPSGFSRYLRESSPRGFFLLI